MPKNRCVTDDYTSPQAESQNRQSYVKIASKHNKRGAIWVSKISIAAGTGTNNKNCGRAWLNSAQLF
jgi:hypothetical protein